MWVWVLVVGVDLALACTRPPSEPDGTGPLAEPVSRTMPEQVEPSPQIHLVVHNFAADEGEMWTYDLDRDGRFVVDGWMSNGGDDRTVWRCQGRIASRDASRWLERVAGAATLTAAPRLPDAVKALESGQSEGFTIGYRTADGAMTYADPAPWNEDLAALVALLRAAQRCTTSTE